MNTGEIHVPVMLEEVIKHFDIKKNGIYIDCTFGNGGHTKAILEKLETGKIIAFEWDKKTVEFIKNNNLFHSSKFHLINDNFSNLAEHLKHLDIKEIDGFLFDLGLSSWQLGEEGRGFSYRLNSPLDMRINQDKNLTAEFVVNNYSYEKLIDIFYYYGEERKARIIARKICYWREQQQITSTQQLVSIIAPCFPKKRNIHPARKIFQSLRIFVNSELENLSQALESAFKYLSPKGKIIVISYHSLEDRIVKQTFKKYSSQEKFQIITKKPLIPSAEEIKKNNKSRSAKMRVIEKINI